MSDAALRAPLLIGFVAAAIGSALGAFLPVWVNVSALVVGLALLGLAWRTGLGVFVAALFVLASTAALGGSLAMRAPPDLPSSCNDPSQAYRVRVVAAVGRRPSPRGLEQPTQVELLAERCGNVWQPRSGRVMLTLGDGPLVARGDEIELKLTLDPVAPRRNPTDVDPLLLARKDDLAGFGSARSEHVVVERGTGVRPLIDRARHRVAAAFEARYPGDLATLAKALSMGDQTAVTPAMREAYSDSGIAHVLSVSGLHVSLVAALVYGFLFRLLGRLGRLGERVSLRRLAAALALPAVIAFCVWSGAPAAAVRATIMGGAVLVGLLLLRPSAMPNAIGLSGILLLVVSPLSLYDPGFLLSFIAVLALLLMPEAAFAETRLDRAKRFVGTLLLTSVIASLATAPITAYFFGRASIAGVVTNLVAIPIGSAVATPLALAYGFVAPWAPRAAELFGVPLEWSLRVLDAVAHLGAKLPFAAVDLPRPTVVELVSYFVLFLAPFVTLRRRRVVMSLAAVVFLGAIGVREVQARAPGTLTLVHPYVGQGDATLVFLPKGGVMLVDAGGSIERDAPDPGHRVLAPLLRQRGVRSIDVAVVTHPHPDHLEGFAYLADRFPIRELWWDGAGEELPTMRKLLRAVLERGGAVHTAHDLPERSEREGVEIRVLHPRPGPEAEGLPYFPEWSANDNSVVLRLQYGERSVLLTGDIEADAEASLAGHIPPVDIVKVPHHGSRTSSTAALLEAVKPRFAVISCGAHNVFGFPHPTVLAAYAGRGVDVLRTDTDGMIELATDGHTWRGTTLRGRVIP